MVPVVFAKSEPVLNCYELKNPVTFDGKWTNPEEWSDVPEIKLEHYKTFAAFYPNTGIVYLRIKHDDSNLYFFMDDTTNTDPKGVPGQGWSFTGIFLDPNNHKSNLIKEDDSMQAVSWVGGTPQFSTLKGPSDVWKLENAKHSPVTVKYTMGTTEKSSIPHVVSEGVIPIGSG
ncbi:MAG: hypothetical protein NTX81_02230, partial [Candidatus Bathyarchaeota archaeon]|nr:hypothetical protein [Candidatus Bathyarchaeota archaeon]